MKSEEYRTGYSLESLRDAADCQHAAREPTMAAAARAAARAALRRPRPGLRCSHIMHPAALPLALRQVERTNLRSAAAARGGDGFSTATSEITGSDDGSDDTPPSEEPIAPVPDKTRESSQLNQCD